MSAGCSPLSLFNLLVFCCALCAPLRQLFMPQTLHSYCTASYLHMCMFIIVSLIIFSQGCRRMLRRGVFYTVRARGGSVCVLTSRLLSVVLCNFSLLLSTAASRSELLPCVCKKVKLSLVKDTLIIFCLYSLCHPPKVNGIDWFSYEQHLFSGRTLTSISPTAVLLLLGEGLEKVGLLSVQRTEFLTMYWCDRLVFATNNRPQQWAHFYSPSTHSLYLSNPAATSDCTFWLSRYALRQLTGTRERWRWKDVQIRDGWDYDGDVRGNRWWRGNDAADEYLS